MKTTFFKIAMSVATVLLAVGGSFVTQASENKAQQALIGYATSINGTPCAVTTLCGDILNTICTVVVGGSPIQAKGKFNPTDTACPIMRRARQ